MIISLAITTPIGRQAFTMPSTALVFQERGTQVAVVTEDNRMHLKTIVVSKLVDNAVEVASGLSENDRIINNPGAALLKGKKVRVVKPEPGYDLPNTHGPSSS